MLPSRHAAQHAANPCLATMAFGQQRTHGRRGRPPKDPSARAAAQRASLPLEEPSSSSMHALSPSAAGMAPLTSGHAPKVRRLNETDAQSSVEEFETLLQDMRMRYEKSIDERVQQAIQERDAIQAQFDRLKDLRMTQSEKTLVEWKKASETRHRHVLESLASWKNRAEHAEHRVKELERTTPRGSEAEPRATQLEQDVSNLTEQLARVQRALGDEQARRADLEEQMHAYTANEDERAIRRMYEDLTGFMVRQVDPPHPEEAHRRYHIVFTGADFYDFQFSLEESKLHVSSSDGGQVVRDDFVYMAHINHARDAHLLASGHMPDHFLEQIRFERGAATKFLMALHRSLKK